MNENKLKIKKVRDFYPEQEVFEEAVDNIFWVFGLELSLIEKLRLKDLVLLKK